MQPRRGVSQIEEILPEFRAELRGAPVESGTNFGNAWMQRAYLGHPRVAASFPPFKAESF